MLANIFFNTGGSGDFKYRKLDMYDPAIEYRKNQSLIAGDLAHMILPTMVRDKNKLNLKLPDGKYVIAIDPGTSKLGFSVGMYDMEYAYILATFLRDNSRLEEKGESAKFRENFRTFFEDFMEQNHDNIMDITMESPFDNYMARKSKSTFPILKAIYDDISVIGKRYGKIVIPVKPQQWKSYYLRTHGEAILKRDFGIYNVNLTRSNKDIIFALSTRVFPDLRMSDEGAMGDACDALGILWHYYDTRSIGEDGSVDNPYNVVKSMERCYKHHYSHKFLYSHNVKPYIEKVIESKGDSAGKIKSSFVVRDETMSLEDNIRAMTTKYKTDIFITNMTDSITDTLEILKRRDKDQIYQLNDVYVVFHRLY